MQRKLQQQEKFASGLLSTEEVECLGFFELTRNNSALSSGPGCGHLAIKEHWICLYFHPQAELPYF